MIPKKPVTPKCALCSASLTGARVVIRGLWHCPECAYKHDHGRSFTPRKRRPKALPLQDTTLFPLPPTGKHERG